MKNLFLVILLFSLTADAQNNPKNYWDKTFFSFRLLEKQYVNDESCSLNKRTYLGCIEAVNSILRSSNIHYKVTTKNHSPDPEYDAYKVVNDFIILKKKLDFIDPNKNLPLPQKILYSRAAEKASDSVWLQQPVYGFSSLLAEVVNMSEVSREKEIVGNAFNSYLSVALDPHSHFIPAEVFNESREDGVNFIGVGITFEPVEAGILIKVVYPGTPAESAQLRPGDVIYNVDGISIAGLKSEKIMNLIRGELNTVVVFRVLRANASLNVSVIRKAVTLDKVFSVKILSDRAHDIAYIKVSDFSGEKSCGTFQNLLKAQQNSRGLIVDLRNNGGGDLRQVSCMLELFIDKGQTLITYRDPRTNRILETLSFVGSELKYYKPLVVLVNQFSASASEIFSGVLQDYQKAFIVGDRTYGKGTVQIVKSVASLGEVYFAQTVARFHLPSGRSNQIVGITPDFLTYEALAPSELEQVSFREMDSNKFPIPAGATVELNPHPDFKNVKSCVDSGGYAQSEFKKHGDYQMQVAVEVINCQAIR